MKTIEELRSDNEVLIKKVKDLQELKRMKFSDVDISEPMSEDEKELTKEIASIWSNVNSNIREIKRLMKSDSLI
jgi:hypothetical protein